MRSPRALPLLVLLLGACGAPRDLPEPDVVARIGGEDVRRAEFETYLVRNAGGGETLASEPLSVLFDRFVEERLLCRLAGQRGVAARDDPPRRAVDALLAADGPLEPTAERCCLYREHRWRSNNDGTVAAAADQRPAGGGTKPAGAGGRQPVRRRPETGAPGRSGGRWPDEGNLLADLPPLRRVSRASARARRARWWRSSTDSTSSGRRAVAGASDTGVSAAGPARTARRQAVPDAGALARPNGLSRSRCTIAPPFIYSGGSRRRPYG